MSHWDRRAKAVAEGKAGLPTGWGCYASSAAKPQLYNGNMRLRTLSCVLLTFLVCLGFASWTVPAVGQECPEASATRAATPSQPRTLEGLLIFHHGIRKWFELKFDQPQCGQTSVELVRGERDWNPMEVLRGCRVRSRGAMDLSGTGYYSLDTYQSVDEVEPVGTCKQQSPLPDFSKAKPDRAIGSYRVEMDVDYEPGDHPIVFHVSSSGKELQPWQAYASYMLTGGFVLYGHCGEGFVVDKVFGTPQANPSHFAESRDSGDMASFDPESAAASGTKHLRLGYTCVRQP